MKRLERLKVVLRMGYRRWKRKVTEYFTSPPSYRKHVRKVFFFNVKMYFLSKWRTFRKVVSFTMLLNAFGWYSQKQVRQYTQNEVDSVIFAVDSLLEEYDLGILPHPNGKGIYVGKRTKIDFVFTEKPTPTIH